MSDCLVKNCHSASTGPVCIEPHGDSPITLTNVLFVGNTVSDTPTYFDQHASMTGSVHSGSDVDEWSRADQVLSNTTRYSTPLTEEWCGKATAKSHTVCGGTTSLNGNRNDDSGTRRERKVTNRQLAQRQRQIGEQHTFSLDGVIEGCIRPKRDTVKNEGFDGKRGREAEGEGADLLVYTQICS
ncbi:hypothetical protein BLNAU_1926 [Blattamonas nauphoetae]|uniref:Uncharacterized protein n=1 Tax=Blattamonas nauphoetae TaxID=2049346 RepID=A0ABQ9YGP9_9EUKA|nr:hypothetical protein BLNAU_1926 [Blattamonas nauphoetae]